ncbi:2-methylisocitrate lyase-like PEP mutase family enzyme [Shimia isoporae]|uniref:2-methylisocitrate lyase-like PEP mutase family enzyme n=1 Tax=Shimia isoporae TaxID=647720 RepID=A0A4R1NSJ3_9RHOB|nr:isocitrate lyase/phosphoenolpyruvate mutase family protein [Shimia isoporae]TCL08228.1 2-methylisocitrate lyase-like PEP mutase family enzyme [Shimia isoporae]
MSDFEKQAVRVAQFREMHRKGAGFVMPNPWDAGSARILAQAGFGALATTSAGCAVGAGFRDGVAAVSRAMILENAAAIVSAVDVPVSADLEDGFGASPEVCAETVRLAAGVGLAGGSIEDVTGGPDGGIYDLTQAVERVSAAAEAARDAGFVLTARCENYLNGRPDLADTISRLQAYGEAGAEVLYAPALPDMEAIQTLCSEVEQPVNVVMGLRGPFYSVAQLQDAGVARISVGGSMARAAYGALQRAAQEILVSGTFGYAEEAMPGAELMAAMRGDALDKRD